MQFASGEPPSNVKNNDLKPEVSLDQAHSAIANAIKLFIQMRVDSKTGLDKVVKQTESLFIKPW